MAHNDNAAPEWIPTDAELGSVTREEFSAMVNFEDLFFVLDDQRRPVAATKEQWEAMPPEQCSVAATDLAKGEVQIRTSFDGAIYSELDDASLLFETHVLIGIDGIVDRRWRSWEEAEAGHAAVVKQYEEWLAGRAAKPDMSVVN